MPSDPVIHPSAVVDPGARLAPGVEIGPFSYVGPKVSLGENTVLMNHATVIGNTSVGADCRIFQGAVVGGFPQDLKYHGEDTLLEIGDNNIIREFVTINKGTIGGGGVTRIGSRNLIMAYVHIAHDCLLGDDIILANVTTLAGHIVIEDKARISGLAALHHYVTVGTLAFIGGASKITQDVPPYCLVDGNPSRVRGLNIEGLKRSGVNRSTINGLKEAFRVLYRSDMNRSQAIDELKEDPLFEAFAEVRHLVHFVEREVMGWRGRGREALRPDRPAGFSSENPLSEKKERDGTG
ncbi:MAG: acyl-ACP--UDP-N-acetylglucosamine O-acyltransferase [Planctomycetes bacterium]|nr:acyl-ACP--UDP-N-acetylglucosamine O-acyltransferase [Planctomycetota bacterium]